MVPGYFRTSGTFRCSRASAAGANTRRYAVAVGPGPTRPQAITLTRSRIAFTNPGCGERPDTGSRMEQRYDWHCRGPRSYRPSAAEPFAERLSPRPGAVPYTGRATGRIRSGRA